MIITRDQLAIMNFGYLSGKDLLQWCNDQLLIKQYAVDPDILQNGCNQAYADLKSRLCNRYDLNGVLSNANQILKKQTGNIQVTIPASTYVSRISFSSHIPPFESSPITGYPNSEYPNINIYPKVTIGTTAGGNDIFPETIVGKSYIFFINKYFSTSTVLYFSLSGSEITINLTANTGVYMPPMVPVALLNKTGSFTLDIPANTYIYQIFGSVLLATPSIQIGTTLGGDDICLNTLIDQNILNLTQQYFATTSTLYFQVTGGSVNLRIDEGLNFTAPSPQPFINRDDFLVKVLSLLAIENILGNLAGDNKKMLYLFEKNEVNIHELEIEKRGLMLPAPPKSIDSIPYSVSSSFKTIG
jgi:hypothetical protein